ncbi:MAG: hypothetical protein K5985_12280, partial [Lachnospiraceae bacterium]|nr:hypothetical protein [Lachnospiraceae bacterium]
MANNKRKHRRRWILKKSVRMSLASLFMILALIVAAIPAPKVEAANRPTGPIVNTYANVNYIFTIDDKDEATFIGYGVSDNKFPNKKAIKTLSIPDEALYEVYDESISANVTIKYPVKTIQANACKNDDDGIIDDDECGIETLVLSDSVETIGASA